MRFGYEPEREILKGVDLDVPPGTTRRGGRAVGRGQVDPRAAAVTASTTRPPAGSRSTARTSPQVHAGEPARGDRHRPAGHGAVQRHHRLQHRLRPRRRRRRPRSRRRRAARRSTISSPRCPQGYDSDGRRARAQAVGRREAARRDRPHPAQGPADPDPRRGDQRARQPHRGRRSRTTLDGVAARPHRRSSSPTACRPSSTPTRSSCSTRAASPSAAPTPSCSRKAASTPRCGPPGGRAARGRSRGGGGVTQATPTAACFEKRVRLRSRSAASRSRWSTRVMAGQAHAGGDADRRRASRSATSCRRWPATARRWSSRR